MSKLRKRLWQGLVGAALIAVPLMVITDSPGTAQVDMTEQLPGAPSRPGYPPGGVQPGVGPRNTDPTLGRIQHQQAVLRNEQRQKDLVKDTDKLLALAKELKAAVEKSDENTMSIDVIKKADEIQKLAKSVRDKMKAD